ALSCRAPCPLRHPLFLQLIRPPPRHSLFPYTTLFRSLNVPGGGATNRHRARGRRRSRIVVSDRAELGCTDFVSAEVVSVWITDQIGRAHVCTPVTDQYRMPSSACKTTSNTVPHDWMFR